MNGIQIGKVISAQRKRKGITQAELAEYLGVSKPAISKWESGQTYPDITFLPVIASFFGISVDELLDYQPQISKEEAQKLYRKLANQFICEPFDQVYQTCKQHIKAYHSCYQLQFDLGLLLVNHAHLAGDAGKIQAIYQQTLEMFVRIAKECDDPFLAKQAIYMQASCYLAIQQPESTIALLEHTISPILSAEPLLATAYQMTGRLLEAKSVLQSYVYQNLVGILSTVPILMLLYENDPVKMQQYYEASRKFGDVLDVQSMHPYLYFGIYLTAAKVFLAQGKRNDALQAIEQYTDLYCAPDTFPLKLQGNQYFDLLDGFFTSLDLGILPPVNANMIQQTLRDAIQDASFYQPLQHETRYRNCIANIQVVPIVRSLDIL